MSSLPLPPLPPHPDPALDPGASSSAGGKKKRGGAPKAKGAVRAKSGCYTCRIRRKKCDEQPDVDGNCQTCVRLRLECLGFGAKRPDWMRENNSVQELREKIKQFLASQGMIKGHSGGGVRPADQDPSVLNLSVIDGGVPNSGTISSSTLSPAGSDHPRHVPRMPPTSSVRDGPHGQLVSFPPLPGGHPFPPPPGQGAHVLFSLDHRSSSNHMSAHGPPMPPHAQHHHPPVMGTIPVHLDPELAYMPPAYGHAAAQPQAPPPPPPQQQQTQQSSRPPMSSVPASPWPSAPSLQPVASSFGASYNIHDDYYQDVEGQVSEISSSEDVSTSMPPELAISPIPLIDDSREALHVIHYMKNVLKIQYLLADSSSIEQFIFRFAQTSPSARSAMCLLSAVHQERMRQIEYPQYPTSNMTEQMDHFYWQTRSLLRNTNTNTITEGDAMAGLHVVSSFLFTGGHGPWYTYLQVAMRWVETVLNDKRYHGPLDAFRHCEESGQFVIRTTMWFDVWSAITRRTVPKFRTIYQELFEGVHGYPGSQIGDVDMLPVMGCTNETVLAMSETAALAFWKDFHTKQGNLSMPRLIERGSQIEARYLSREHDASLDAEYVGSDGLDVRRRLAANVFRASARVYLHSVLSGCRPNVEEIAYGVTETVGFLKQVPNSEGATRTVVRSVVLSIALCGCMTDDAEHRSYLSSCLVSLAGQEVEVLGNCTQAKRLMERVWSKRAAGETAVDWRDVIREMAVDILLLV